MPLGIDNALRAFLSQIESGLDILETGGVDSPAPRTSKQGSSARCEKSAAPA